MIRLIALDVDGTLLTPEGTVSPETVKAVGEAHALGVRVALCTQAECAGGGLVLA